MARYDLQDARKYISKAIIRLNKARGLNIALLDLEYTDLIGHDFIKVHLYDKNLNHKFVSVLNEIIFNRKDTMSSLDNLAGISKKELDDDTKAIIRIAYTIWRDWRRLANDDMN